jgi:hypothetical protein
MDSGAPRTWAPTVDPVPLARPLALPKGFGVETMVRARLTDPDANEAPPPATRLSRRGSSVRGEPSDPGQRANAYSRGAGLLNIPGVLQETVQAKQWAASPRVVGALVGSSTCPSQTRWKSQFIHQPRYRVGFQPGQLPPGRQHRRAGLRRRRHRLRECG